VCRLRRPNRIAPCDPPNTCSKQYRPLDESGRKRGFQPAEAGRSPKTVLLGGDSVTVVWALTGMLSLHSARPESILLCVADCWLWANTLRILSATETAPTSTCSLALAKKRLPGVAVSAGDFVRTAVVRHRVFSPKIRARGLVGRVWRCGAYLLAWRASSCWAYPGSSPPTDQPKCRGWNQSPYRRPSRSPSSCAIALFLHCFPSLGWHPALRSLRLVSRVLQAVALHTSGRGHSESVRSLPGILRRVPGP